ncbi:Phosphatidylinositol 4-kinase LSB6 [Tilletia horrida]|nr:Phosphatidylinositol 4-kinase LSB6 [Tilletia horrida]
MDEREPLLGPSSSRPSAAAAAGPAPSATHAAPAHQPPLPVIADLDERLRRWKLAIAERFTRNSKGKGKEAFNSEPVALISVFQQVQVSGPGYASDATQPQPQHQAASNTETNINGNGHVGTSASAAAASSARISAEVQQQVEQVRAAIDQGVFPQMITTGSSGSYFARRVDLESGRHETVAVFKPRDEEPYGNANPKRVYVRKYLWWMMGRSCLVPNFSASSEAGASYLDTRLNLHVVPPTYLVSLSSPSFFYPHADREAWRKHKKRPPEKVGSFQVFLRGYVNASTFLRQHPWPSRPAYLLEADLAAEQAAHKLSRKKPKAKLRKCLIAIKRFLLCRTAPLPLDGFEGEEAAAAAADAEDMVPQETNGDFRWTPETMRAFRVELEKLVVLDFLMRNTDRGLDNFMIRTSKAGDSIGTGVQLGAIDNSLSFPHRHPNGIRDYPFGWLWLPADLIGQPFSAETRNHFLPLLSNPSWWIETVAGLRSVFEQDEHFSAKVFERQMAVMRGQGLSLVESLMNASEGPIELCARPRMLVFEEVVRMTKIELRDAAQLAVPGLFTHHHYEPHARRPSWQQQHSSDTRDLDTVAERDASDAEDDDAAAADRPGVSQPVPLPRGQVGENGRDAAAAFDTSVGPHPHPPPPLSPDAAHPRSLPETDSATHFSALAAWQMQQHGRARPSSPSREPERSLLETLDRSMTGIEVLEREMAMAAAGSEHEFRFLPKRQQTQQTQWRRRVGSENEVQVRAPPALGRSSAASPEGQQRGERRAYGEDHDDEEEAEEEQEEIQDGSARGAGQESRGRGGGTRQRIHTSGSGGGLARFFSSASFAAASGVGEGVGRAQRAGPLGRLTRSNSEHISVLEASVMSLPAPTGGAAGSQGQQRPGAGAGAGAARGPELRPSLRKRMGSVSGWSITSLGAESQAAAAGAGAGGGSHANEEEAAGEDVSAAMEGKVKVIIQVSPGQGFPLAHSSLFADR